MRIVFLGDSLTWGGYGGDFVAEVARRLPRQTIINAGVGGDTVVNLMRRVEDVIDRHSPDAMFVMVGGNDAISYTQPATRPYYQQTKGLDKGTVTPDQFEATYRELLTTIQLHLVQAMVGLAPTEYNAEIIAAKQQYNAIAEGVARKLNLPVLDLDKPFTPAQTIERRSPDLGVILEIGKRHKSGWSDYEAERRRWGYTYTFDGMHLTPQAAPQFADYIVPFLKNALSL